MAANAFLIRQLTATALGKTIMCFRLPGVARPSAPKMEKIASWTHRVYLDSGVDQAAQTPGCIPFSTLRLAMTALFWLNPKIAPILCTL